MLPSLDLRTEEGVDGDGDEVVELEEEEEEEEEEEDHDFERFVEGKGRKVGFGERENEDEGWECVQPILQLLDLAPVGSGGVYK